MSGVVLETECPDLKLLARGKVRDIYHVEEGKLLFVATDRLSAFDVVMENGIPGKGKILTQLSLFWFDLLKDVMPNHLINANFDEMPANVQKYRGQLEGRSMLVNSLTIYPIEAIVRGYIAGSGWKEYQTSGTVCSIPLPEGLLESDKLPSPLFTPSTKAEIGDHDENISPAKAAEIIGAEAASTMEKLALAVYSKARDYALTKGIIIADTKFEFGKDAAGTMILADEVLTPDSSRFWPVESYQAGKGQDSFDKQYVRDFLLSIGFDKSASQSVTLPEEVVKATLGKYIEAFTLLTGHAPSL
ncbi:Bifunctional purine biosynthetic protein ade1 [Entomophthora muscae]|uniref:Bifunctional purine biosynthetic protein ade1 n=1 Tax=Entomophthora muscae TaxID=34485 RepID=A0ACC2UIM9_9FUNG|nr:Bifunctional purine biosynthetic protein ade1 [Entomophthora muscae]